MSMVRTSEAALLLVIMLLTGCSNTPVVPLQEACTDQSIGQDITTEGYLLLQDPLHTGAPCYGREDAMWCFMWLVDDSASIQVVYSSNPNSVANPFSPDTVLRSGEWIRESICRDRADCLFGKNGSLFQVRGECVADSGSLLVTDFSNIKPLTAAVERPTVSTQQPSSCDQLDITAEERTNCGAFTYRQVECENITGDACGGNSEDTAYNFFYLFTGQMKDYHRIGENTYEHKIRHLDQAGNDKPYITHVEIITFTMEGFTTAHTLTDTSENRHLEWVMTFIRLED